MISTFYRELAPWLVHYGFDSLHGIIASPGELGPDPVECVAVMFLDPGGKDDSEPSDFHSMMHGESHKNLKLAIEKMMRKHGVFPAFDGPCKIRLYETLNDFIKAEGAPF